jgi:hypothetical protein
MTRKDIFLVVLVAALGGMYVGYFTDWFRPKVMRIEHSARPLREAWTGDGKRVDPTGKQVNNVTFALHKDYRLTSVRVVPAAEAQTNKAAHTLWHLISKAGSPPVNGFAYGQPIPGMTSSVPGFVTEPLEPGVQYRLLVEAGPVKGTNDFSIPERAAARR